MPIRRAEVEVPIAVLWHWSCSVVLMLGGQEQSLGTVASVRCVLLYKVGEQCISTRICHISLQLPVWRLCLSLLLSPFVPTLSSRITPLLHVMAEDGETAGAITTTDANSNSNGNVVATSGHASKPASRRSELRAPNAAAWQTGGMDVDGAHSLLLRTSRDCSTIPPDLLAFVFDIIQLWARSTRRSSAIPPSSSVSGPRCRLPTL